MGGLGDESAPPSLLATAAATLVELVFFSAAVAKRDRCCKLFLSSFLSLPKRFAAAVWWFL
jgi:hypothetical protein